MSKPSNVRMCSIMTTSSSTGRRRSAIQASPTTSVAASRELIGPYHRCVAETVGRFDGFVAKYMGEGVMIYFGYPQAHEDDAERAVRAGLGVMAVKIARIDVAARHKLFQV